MSPAAKARLDDLIARARKDSTKAALRKVLGKATRADWLAAEKAVWSDVPLTTNDALWVRSQGLALPGKSSGAEQLDD